MKNQTTFNDIFKFVKLKASNILKAFPPSESSEVEDIKLLSKKEKQRHAHSLFSNNAFPAKHLNYGTAILREFRNQIKNQKSTVRNFFSTIQGQQIADFKSDAFTDDMKALSKAMYLANYTVSGTPPKDLIHTYLAYNILHKALGDAPF